MLLERLAVQDLREDVRRVLLGPEVLNCHQSGAAHLAANEGLVTVFPVPTSVDGGTRAVINRALLLHLLREARIFYFDRANEHSKQPGSRVEYNG